MCPRPGGTCVTELCFSAAGSPGLDDIATSETLEE